MDALPQSESREVPADDLNDDTSIMLWILISLFFFWCAFREIRSSFIAPPGFDLPTPVSKPYLAFVLALAALFAWPTVHRWHFQHFLSEKATELADNHRAKVHCNTMFDTMLDSEMLASGHANPLTGEIGIQKPWCDTAKRNALDYYDTSYQQRGKIGGMQGAYYSDQCAPGKAMDEHLSDSTWAAP
jgi:hypothetical protein